MEKQKTYKETRQEEECKELRASRKSSIILVVIFSIIVAGLITALVYFIIKPPEGFQSATSLTFAGPDLTGHIFTNPTTILGTKYFWPYLYDKLYYYPFEQNGQLFYYYYTGSGKYVNRYTIDGHYLDNTPIYYDLQKFYRRLGYPWRY